MKIKSERSEGRAAAHEVESLSSVKRKPLQKLAAKKQETVNNQTDSSLIHRSSLLST